MTKESKVLPIEIYDITFQYLPQKSLLECQRVCQLWYSYAASHLMNYVFFNQRSKVLKFLNCQSNITSAVKKMILGTGGFPDSSNQLSKEIVQKLMTQVPNLQELKVDGIFLPICHLNNTELPTSLTSIIIDNFNYITTQDINEHLKILIKLRNTIQKFNLKTNEFFENTDMIKFFGSFPKLTELDLEITNSIVCFDDYLPIVQAIPSLKSLNIMADINSDFSNIIQFKKKFDTLEKLHFSACLTVPNTLSFIIHNFVGLKQIFVRFSLHSITDLHYSVIFLEFLKFVYSIDIHNFKFKTNHKFYQHCLSNFISNTVNQLPRNNQKVYKHLHVTFQCLMSENIDHKFELKSNIDYYNQLQRKIYWDITYGENHIDELYSCLVSIGEIDVDIFTFVAFITPSGSPCLDLFFKLLSLIKEPKKVVLITSRNPKFSTYKPSNRFNHITQLELQLSENTFNKQEEEDLPFFLDTFPNLKTLCLKSWCGIWNYECNGYSLDLSLQNLESLHLDITRLVYIVKCHNKSRNFRLVVETSTVRHLYDVSLPSLHATKISQVESEEFLNNDCILLCIKIQSIQKLHLKGSESLMYSCDMSLSTPPYEMETLIIL